MTIAVLANPTAAKGRHRGLVPAVVDRLGQGAEVLVAASSAEAVAVCREAVAGGAQAIVAVGGDGTVHCALQAVAGSGVPLGVVPAGTGNDFAVALGLPADPAAAAAACAGALAAGRTRRVDLGRLTGPDGRQRWFGAVLGAGFDAIVNERANRMRWPKGDRRYDIAIFLELVKLRPLSYTLKLDGRDHTADAVLVAVGNTSSYGGGMRICPAADPTDGLLDVVVGGRFSRREFVRLKPTVYRGRHVDHRLVSTYRVSTVEIEAEGITTYADGERAFPLPVSVASVPGALTLLASDQPQ